MWHRGINSFAKVTKPVGENNRCSYLPSVPADVTSQFGELPLTPLWDF